MADTEQTALTKANNDTQEISIESAESDIKSMIYVIRNQQVMIDSDLAMLYQVETRVLNQAVKRNISRFPERFRFQLTKEEYENLKSQFVISSLEDDNGYGGRRKLPFVFTEQGIAMLSAVLRSDVAIRVSIRIMDTFVEMRKYMANTSLLYERLNAMEVRQINYQAETDERFERVFEYISEHEESSQKVFFDGQIYDAFSLIVNLIQKAEKEITLIDGYVDVGTLNLLSKKKSDVAVTIYTQKQTKLTKADVKYFNAQYPTLKIKYTKVFHDRFLIIKMPFLLIGLKIMLKSLLIEKAEVLCSKSFFLVLHNPVHCLAELKNQLIQQGIYTDCVDGLIFRVIHAPVKKLRVEQAIILFLLTNLFTIHGH